MAGLLFVSLPAKVAICIMSFGNCNLTLLPAAVEVHQFQK
jgi:hypothetical protein